MGDITTAFVKQFGTNLEALVQQKGSRLRNAVRIETGITGEEAYFDQLASTAAQKKTTRNSDTPLVKSDHKRRRVAMYDYEWADLIDKEDQLKMLIDPKSMYTQNAAWALGRAIDDAIIEAFDATAYTGKAGGTSTSFTAGNIIAAGGAGLTINKLISAKELLDEGESDPQEERYIVCTANQITDLLKTTEIKSADYNTVRALVQGQIDTFLGFKFIRSERLTVDTSSYREVMAYVKSGMLLAISKEIATRIDERADKSYATQVYASMGIGSTRMEEAKCVQILCSES